MKYKMNKTGAAMAGKSTFLEKIFYGMGGVGMNLCWTFMLIYITVYYTNSVGISAGVVGTFMLASRLLDGVSDFAFAALMEKVHFKLGKIRPWFLICAPLLGISLILCFNVPMGLSANGKVAYAFATYAFTAAVSYTIANLAYAAFLPLLSQDDKDRGIASTVGNILIMGGVIGINTVTPFLLAFRGGESAPGAWRLVSTLYAVLCVIFVSLLAAIKEKDVTQTEGEEGVEKEAELRERTGFFSILKCVLKCKYTWLLLLIYIFVQLKSGLASAGYYSAIYVLENTSVFGAFSTASTGMTILGMFLTPLLFQKLGKKNTIILTTVVSIAGSLVIYINPRSIGVMLVSSVLRGLGDSAIVIAVFVFIADITTYLLKKNKIHSEKVVSMTSSIGTKIGAGFGAAIVGWVLQLVHFNPLEAVQSAGTLSGIIFLNAGLPAVFSICIIVFMLFWNIDKDMAGLDV